jgi:outer membrane protein
MGFNFWALPALFAIGTLRVYSAEVITWQTGVQEATSTNSELKAATSSLQSSSYKVKVARSGFLPQINATAGYNYDSTNFPKYYSATLNATENLFSGFSDSSKVDQAGFIKSGAEANLESIIN